MKEDLEKYIIEINKDGLIVSLKYNLEDSNRNNNTKSYSRKFWGKID